MREIKFRVYSKLKKRMFQWEEIPSFVGLNALSDNVENEKYSSWMQYTGLKDDVNATEIFERDIVNRQVFDYGEKRIFVGEVKMFEGAWWIDNGKAAVPLWNENHLFEVIGNIYENPELLEQEVKG
ncbi:YopX family protein [Alkalihalobacillus trypoxylicola]|uniref:YopX protein domain-containing protein n=1 Tax=Alkalihalobacillus trypoxylicola TaxID=519424 RepID=A0A161PH95_9BACI|nr:YopX family protein [Alkalihalobacillus trypoxylicola]KYG28143.1 hypothetical protein AZF04_09575 [Alkalihalobacillus trypoxylicola]